MEEEIVHGLCVADLRLPFRPPKVRELDLSRGARPTRDEVGRAGIR